MMHYDVQTRRGGCSLSTTPTLKGRERKKRRGDEWREKGEGTRRNSRSDGWLGVVLDGVDTMGQGHGEVGDL